MEKLFRSELKSIVKECLIEILSEGLLGNNQPINESSSVNSLSSKRKNTIKRNSHLDKITFGNTKKGRNVKPNIDTNITSNPIINSMLKDTALSTLQEQAHAEKNPYAAAAVRQGDQATKIVDNSSPDELFGEVSDKWASLAFS